MLKIWGQANGFWRKDLDLKKKKQLLNPELTNYHSHKDKSSDKVCQNSSDEDNQGCFDKSNKE